MLGSIRNKTKGWVAYTIIGLIIVPFALFGIAEYSTNTSNIVVATIDNDEILQTDYLSRFNQQKRILQQRLGDNYTDAFEKKLKRSTVQNMINEHLLGQLAEKLSHVSTTAELQSVVYANDEFKVDGRFSLDKYKQLLRLNGYTATRYETTVLGELTQKQIKQNLLDSAFVSKSVLKKLQSLKNQQRKFNFIRLNTDDYTNQVKVEDKRIQDFYNEKKDSFFEPEQVKLDFVELSLKQIAKNIKVNDEELRDFYEQEKQRFSTEEERRAQHILFKDKAQASKILVQLKQNGDFGKLAKQYSQDTGSKDNAGDLGFFTRGVMVPEFEAKAFAMQENEMSDLVKSEFGYHIIKLNKIKLGTVKSFDETRAELLDLYTQEEAKKQLYNLTEQLANLAYEASLEEVANQMNLTLKTTEFFNKDNTKLNKKMVSAAFSNVVLNQGENSAVLELSKDKFAVVRLQEKTPQRQKTFDEVQAQIKTHLNLLSAKTLISKITTNIAILLKNGDNKAAKKIIDKHKLKWQKLGWVNRSSNKTEAKIIEKVFVLPKPVAQNSTYNAIDFGNSYSVVVELSGVKEIAADTQVSDALQRSLLVIETEEVFQAILATLRRKADLKIFANRL